MSNMVFGRGVEGDLITHNVDFLDTVMAAQEYADMMQEPVFVFEDDEFVAEIVPSHMCGGCGSKEIGPTEAACLMCSLRACKDLWS